MIILLPRISRCLNLNKALFMRQAPLMYCSSDIKVLKEHSLQVPSFGGSLWVKFPNNVHVQPTNTMDYPNLDQAFVRVCQMCTELTRSDIEIDPLSNRF